MKQILLVEPDMLVGQALKTLLRFLGFHVTWISGCPPQKKFDCIMGDLEALYSIKENSPILIPIITDPNDIPQATALGATCILRKPIRQEVLHAALLAVEQIQRRPTGYKPDSVGVNTRNSFLSKR